MFPNCWVHMLLKRGNGILVNSAGITRLYGPVDQLHLDLLLSAAERFHIHRFSPAAS